MTDFEMLSLLAADRALISTGFMNFFTILTAYLAAGYLAAHRITLSMAVFVTTIFVLASIYWLTNVMGTYAGLRTLLAKIHAAALTGGNLGGTPAASGGWALVADLASYVALALMISGIIGGIYFFFQSRRTGHETMGAQR